MLMRLVLPSGRHCSLAARMVCKVDEASSKTQLSGGGRMKFIVPVNFYKDVANPSV